MFLTVYFCHRLALGTKIFFESRIDKELLANRVPRKLPGKLVAIALLVVRVGRADHLIVVLLKLAVILDNGVRDHRHVGNIAAGRSLKISVSWAVKSEYQPLRGKRASRKHGN